jgi:hypothetical protein
MRCHHKKLRRRKEWGRRREEEEGVGAVAPKRSRSCCARGSHRAVGATDDAVKTGAARARSRSCSRKNCDTLLPL